jgi:hypothetical protein
VKCGKIGKIQIHDIGGMSRLSGRAVLPFCLGQGNAMAVNSYDTYDIGDAVRCDVSFTDMSGVAADPTAVLFKYEDPSENETTLTYGVDVEVVRDAVGEYHVDVTIDEAGRWAYRWEGTGTVVSATELEFDVRKSRF